MIGGGAEWWGFTPYYTRTCVWGKGAGEPLYQVYQPHHYKTIPQLRKNESQLYLAKPQLCNAKPQL